MTAKPRLIVATPHWNARIFTLCVVEWIDGELKRRKLRTPKMDRETFCCYYLDSTPDRWEEYLQANTCKPLTR